jgi:hypothetical protein
MARRARHGHRLRRLRRHRPPRLIVTNHETEMHSLFLNEGAQLFSIAGRFPAASDRDAAVCRFGVVFFDYDNNGWLDVSIVNGHVMANVAKVRSGGKLAQRKLLLRNDSGAAFRRTSPERPVPALRSKVSAARSLPAM